MNATTPMGASASSSDCAEQATNGTAPDRRAWARYEARLQRVITHVHAHLDEPLDLNALADVAHLSPHHWHRVYHAMTGETLAGTVKRLRLQRAAAELANGTLPVSRIARQAGYPDVASFTRIFKASYGLPPARYRSEGSHAAYQTSATPLAEGFTPAPGQQVTVLSLPALQLLAVEHRGSYMEIGQGFERLFGTLAAHGLARPGMRTLGLYHDDPDAIDQAALRSHAAVSGAADPGGALPAGLQRITLPAARYAVLLHQGPYSSMRAAYRWLFGTWLPHSGFDIADAPIVEDYLNNPRHVAPTELRTNICLPLRD
jgi:AraC family transcriptional regulator